MSFTRRDFVRASGVALAAAAVRSQPLLAQLGARPEPVPPMDDPRLQELTARALEAAGSAGATYADVRLTHEWNRSVRSGAVSSLSESMEVGVRALCGGHWGFASGPVWSPDEMGRLGHSAASQAKNGALGKPRDLALAPVSAVPNGQWVMPVRSDPFTLPPAEIEDYLESLWIFTKTAYQRYVHSPRPQSNTADFAMQEKVFASSVGTYCAQRLYRTSGSYIVAVASGRRVGSASLDCLTSAGMGWELYTGQPLRDGITAAIEATLEDLSLPLRPVDVGRYTTVIDAPGMARLLQRTVGAATELDRALGFEADAGGTSYLDDPQQMLGAYKVGSELLSIHADRNIAGGCATVAWDDEGVPPEKFTLVRDGLLIDYQTTREMAPRLYGARSSPSGAVPSHGCACAPTGMDIQMLHQPNLGLQPGTATGDFDDLIKDVARGVAIKGYQPQVDFECLDGFGLGTFYEIRNGKRVATLVNAGNLFQTPQLFKGLRALGGAQSAKQYGMTSYKGQPGQACYLSVTAVPATLADVAVIDITRKA